ncbi:MAG TPA: cyclic nucleotide-binding domain-containing protein [Gammaproteobacteria bacterium]|nr:cyclic nucleotide-binding domain-containing protein [Gammaproteobacteria bacterium]
MSDGIELRQLLRHLVPLNELMGHDFDQLVRDVTVETLAPGRTLFEAGNNDRDTFYLLSGEVALVRPDGSASSIVGGTPPSHAPLDHHRPHQTSAIARTAIQFVRIDADLLDLLLTWNQNADYIVSEIEDDATGVSADSDWMTRLLQAKVFHRIPPANIQAIFMRMEAVSARAGQTIVQQGDEADYYYMIREGRCAVIRNAAETGHRDTVVAELGPGDGFGEDALVSDQPRNATVRMLDDGTLMRLSKADFLALLKAPLVKTVPYEQARALVAEGAQWLDVRLPSEYRHRHLPGSINIPLFLLRLNAHKLSAERTYLVYCDTGSRSTSAAFILEEFGLDALVLERGLMGVPAGGAVVP